MTATDFAKGSSAVQDNDAAAQNRKQEIQETEKKQSHNMQMHPRAPLAARWGRLFFDKLV